MKHIKPLTLAILATGFMTTIATGAYAQNSEFRSNAIQKRGITVAQFSKKPDTAIVQLQMEDLKDTKRIKQQALSRSLAPKIQQAAERQGVKVSQSEIMDASDKLASIMSNTDVFDVGEALPGIRIKVSFKFRPLEIGVEITF